MPIEIINRQRSAAVDRRAIRRLTARILEDHGRGDADVTVVVASDRFLRGLNSAYRGLDAATDVLSFGGAPRAGAGGRGRRGADAPEDVLGDVVISTNRAAEQAEARGVPFGREMLKLVAHGVLHLLGYDHDDPKARRSMALLENRYVREAEGR
jgi:probable rRNA maturation factor